MRIVLYGLIIALTSVGITLLIVEWLNWRRARTNRTPVTSTISSVLPQRTTHAPNRDYVANTTLLHASEQYFALLLRDILPAGYTYTVCVAVNRLVMVRQLRRRRAWQDVRWNRIAQKSIDVVIMRVSDTKPVLVLLFEDNTHTGAAVVRDEFLASVLREINLPVVYIATSTMHIRDAVLHQIRPFLPA